MLSSKGEERSDDGYSDENFEEGENYKEENKGKKLMRKNTSKTNSAYVDKVVQDEP